MRVNYEWPLKHWKVQHQAFSFYPGKVTGTSALHIILLSSHWIRVQGETFLFINLNSLVQIGFAYSLCPLVCPDPGGSSSFNKECYWFDYSQNAAIGRMKYMQITQQSCTVISEHLKWGNLCCTEARITLVRWDNYGPGFLSSRGKRLVIWLNVTSIHREKETYSSGLGPRRRQEAESSGGWSTVVYHEREEAECRAPTEAG